MTQDTNFPPMPIGWFAVGLSKDLAPGDVESVRYFGEDLVLYRTDSGEARLSGAYCPHLGAHLGDGKVSGDRIVCPFHSFEFDGSGRCVKTPYPSGRPPAKARIEQYPIVEQSGVIFAWYHPQGAQPTFDIAPVDEAGWSKYIWKRFEFRGHPQETTENSVDLGHFSVVHGYTDSGAEGPLNIDGPLLTASYRMHRSGEFVGLPHVKVRADFDVTAWGLGYSRVQARVRQIKNWEARLLVLSTPIDHETIHLRLGMAMRDFPIKFLNPIVQFATAKAYQHDVAQDIPVWSKKIHIRRPMLAEGDGPIGAYRRYAKQFYVSEDVSEVVPVARLRRAR